MTRIRYLRSIFAIIETHIHIELTDQGRGVIENYLKTAASSNLAEKARYAIFRYAQIELPSLDEIRKKNKTDPLSAMDHLILKMEYASKQYAKRGSAAR